MTADTRLVFMTFPQRWRAGALDIRVLVLPRNNPRVALVPGSLAFADANFKVAVRMIPDPGKLPNAADALPAQDLNLVLPPNRPQLYSKLDALFSINIADGAGDPGPTPPSFYKFLPESFRNASGLRRSPSGFGVIDDQYACALKTSSLPSSTPLQTPSVDLSWGDVLQFALRQPRLAIGLGLLFDATLPLVPGHAMRGGGWLYTELDTTGDFSAEFAADHNLTASYAAKIPPLDDERSLFAPSLVAVATSPGTPPIDDDVLTELDQYSDGFSAFVHGAQPETSNVSEDEDHPLPAAKDVGIRLGWDDEQILVWLNRQMTADPNAPGHTPCCVAGYRVDVRLANSGDDFRSLCAVEGDLDLDGIALGHFDGELNVETVPVRFPNNDRDWLPPYFTAWAGGSLVSTNVAATPFDGRPIAQHAPSQYTPADADTIGLRYGRNYEFRVRLADLSGGGAPSSATPASSKRATTVVPFRRCVKPKPPTLELAAGQTVQPDTASYKILRPRLGFPEAVFTDAAGAHAGLVADIATSRVEGREPGIHDPDVKELDIVVEVRALAGDTAPGGYQPLYSTTRKFPAAAHVALALDLDFDDVPDLGAFGVAPLTGPIPIPSARDVRISLTAVCGARASYYQSDEHRRSIAPLVLNVRKESSSEADLFDDTLAPARYIRGCYFQPDAIEDSPLRAAGLRNEAPSSISGRLAEEVGLACSGLTLFARQGHRLIAGCSAGLRHVLAPDRSAVQFASKDDLARRWIVVVQTQMLRDWTWDGLEPVAFKVMRVLDGLEEEVGTIEIVRATSPVAIEKADRSRSHLCFFDAIDPKTEDAVFPAEIEVGYRFEPAFRQAAAIETPEWSLRLPVSTPPLQTPKLTSAGIAFAPYARSADYSSTDPRRRSLWIEFEAPPRDPLDRYFCRVLAHAPDPLLGVVGQPPDLVREHPLPIDPEPVRVILPGQPEDDNGLNAMQPLESTEPGATRFLVPFPPGLNADSPELFGMFTYEFRLGHDARRWSTARGRFGPPLRVTGVQHPAPTLPCYVLRTDTMIETGAPFAEGMSEGRDAVASPNTEMWFMLYAQVREASGAGWRNVLLKRTRGNRPERLPEGSVRYSTAAIELGETAVTLRGLALSPEAPLSVLAVELIPAPLLGPRFPPNRYADPLGADLGQVRILRSSPLVPVPAAC